jgi:hypothetical protein
VTDVLVNEALNTGGSEPDGEAPGPLFVCPYELDDGTGICGKHFDDKRSFNGHAIAIHGYTWDGKHRPDAKASQRGKGKGSSAKADQAPKTATRAEKKVAKDATGPAGSAITDSNRAAIYTQSLATIGMLGHLAAGRWFDDYDLDVWSRGTPGLANALDAVGEQNPGVRRTCDLLLAGGSGGAYVQLVLAATMIAVPIAAHHDFLPKATGERFGAMIGAMAPGAPESAAPSPAPPAPPVQLDGTVPMSEWTYDQWRDVLFAAPQNPNGMQVMMDMTNGNVRPPTEVFIPDMAGTTPMDIPQEEHRGTVGTDNGAAGTDETVPAET